MMWFCLCVVQSPGPGELQSPRARPMGMDLQGWRLRLSGIKDTFANTTRSLKGRWGGHHRDHHSHHQNHHHREDREGSPPGTPSASSSAAAHMSNTPQSAAL